MDRHVHGARAACRAVGQLAHEQPRARAVLRRAIGEQRTNLVCHPRRERKGASTHTRARDFSHTRARGALRGHPQPSTRAAGLGQAAGWHVCARVRGKNASACARALGLRGVPSPRPAMGRAPHWAAIAQGTEEGANENEACARFEGGGEQRDLSGVAPSLEHLLACLPSSLCVDQSSQAALRRTRTRAMSTWARGQRGWRLCVSAGGEAASSRRHWQHRVGCRGAPTGREGGGPGGMLQSPVSPPAPHANTTLALGSTASAHGAPH